MKIAQTITAADAFHAQVRAGNVGILHNRILAYLAAFPDRDFSIGELAHRMHLEKSTVAARLNELLTTGHVVECPRRKDDYSGITIRPVAIPKPGQQELFA